MEHPFFPTTTNRVKALQWLSIAEKLLATRDLLGSKTFATRARDSDPTISSAEEILAIADTLIVGDRRIGSGLVDWYAVLRLSPQQGQDGELVASHYQSLALLLNPQMNRFPFAEDAFRLVFEAWSVLSNPSRKCAFDKEAFSFVPPQQLPHPFITSTQAAMHQTFLFFGRESSGGVPQPHGGTHFPQVQAPSSCRVAPVISDSVREPQNFMRFASDSTSSFAPLIKSTHETRTRSEQLQEETRTTFESNVVPAPAPALPPAPIPIQEQVDAIHKKMHTERFDGDVDSIHHAGLNSNAGEKENNDVPGREHGDEGINKPVNDEGTTFWTACPYCYYMYEYPTLYIDCTLKCPNCKRAFQGVVVSRPPVEEAQGGFFCCWGFLPLGYSIESWKKNKDAAPSWTPFSPMFSCPQPWSRNSAPKQKKSSVPRVYFDDDDELFVDVSDSSGSDDIDWNGESDTESKKTNTLKRKGASGTPSRGPKKPQSHNAKDLNLQDAIASPNRVETPHKAVSESNKKGLAVNARKQPGRVAMSCGRLDLNVEFNNETEEQPVPRVEEGPGPSCGDDDNIEANGFFEGLDEFFNSLPILNTVADDKVVKTA